ncbi:SAM-dependent methyltransferase [Actinomadura sp. DC4]|uniref:SAM-dependent methyltransferase n=1 Tax=Actinomadura sp. DC4 TaxID=3055069 RepID=UPI0025B25246|nr:SAM-dependent methyltransferase [Actinomadura sp. DC4]MDN3352108.1 SAM-dependent methyltransferase [Actinomadura sp. DC4]
MPEQAPPVGIDTSRPSVARMYDYYLDGKDNYAVDRAAVDKVAEALPEVRQVARENRAFLRRAVRHMARQGIRQFIDIGSGLPTAGNTHEIAQEIIPDARVVYVDNDPVVLAHGRALLAADDNTTVATADLHSPDDVLGHAQTTKLIDFAEPVGVLLIAMVHFLTSEERPRVMGRLHGALAPGSHIAATHTSTDGQSPDATAQIEAVYATTPTPIYLRSRAEIEPFFDGFALVAPGLVMLDEWQPDPEDPGPAPTRWMYGGVGHKLRS